MRRATMRRATMSGAVPIRVALLLAAGSGAAAAQAGRGVPPPLPIRPVQPLLLQQAPPAPVRMPMAALWRDTPPVMEGWSPDRRIPVVASRRAPCNGRSLAAMADDDWFDGDAELAGAGFDDDDFGPWEDM